MTGIVNNVMTLLKAVRDTDNATSPLAIMEKILDELPPGEQAISTKPIKKSGSNLKTKPMANANKGKNTNCPTKPATIGRGRWRNNLKSVTRKVKPNSNINNVRMGNTIHTAFIEFSLY